MSDKQSLSELPQGIHDSSRLSIRRLVKTDLRIVEPMQIEASFEHRLMIKQGTETIYPNRYQVESYFIFPPQMKVNKSTYPIDYFYRDMKSFFNFRIPKLSYKEMMGISEDEDRSPLKKMLHEVDDESRDWSAQRQAFVEEEARIFACSFFTFLKRKVKRMHEIFQDLSQTSMPNETLELLDEAEKAFRDSLAKVLNIYREWQKVSRIVGQKVPSLQAEFHNIDEYLLINIKEVVLELDLTLQRYNQWKDLKDRWRQKLKAILRLMRMYAAKEQFVWVDSMSPTLDLERYFFRRGVLKRRIWSALYLDTRTKPLFFIQKQASAMMAAGLAGAWAITADLTVRMQTGMTVNAQSLGLSTFLLATALVVAYVMKDRIKEASKNLFKGSVLGNIPDNSCKILYSGNTMDSDLIHVGNQEEKASIKDSDKLPPDIVALLAIESSSSLENETSTVIKYSKTLELKGQRTRKLKRKIRAIYTFYRLNVSALLSPLDSPFAEHLLPNRRFEAGMHLLPKVYHIDLVIRVSGDGQIVRDVTYHYFKLIVDKEGIRRIDRIRIPGDTEEQPAKDALGF